MAIKKDYLYLDMENFPVYSKWREKKKGTDSVHVEPLVLKDAYNVFVCVKKMEHTHIHICIWKVHVTWSNMFPVRKRSSGGGETRKNTCTFFIFEFRIMSLYYL